MDPLFVVGLVFVKEVQAGVTRIISDPYVEGLLDPIGFQVAAQAEGVRHGRLFLVHRYAQLVKAFADGFQSLSFAIHHAPPVSFELNNELV